MAQCYSCRSKVSLSASQCPNCRSQLGIYGEERGTTHKLAYILLLLTMLSVSAGTLYILVTVLLTR